MRVMRVRWCGVLVALSMVGACEVASAQDVKAQHVWTAKWIAAPWSTERDGAEVDGSHPMPVFRRAFELHGKPEQATLRIAGLGQWKVMVGRGKHAVEAQPKGLHGSWTDYRKTVAYDSVDVTRMVGKGKGSLAVMLGNGMYNVQRTALPGVARGRFTKFVGSFGVPKLIAELEVRYKDGRTETIATDAQWRVARGPVIFDSTYGGEDYDARVLVKDWETARFNDAAWEHAAVVEGPGGALVPMMAPAVGQHAVHVPVKETKLANGAVVFDLGQNFAGVAQVRVKGPAGAVLRLAPGELLNADGSVSQATFHGPVWWTYTLRGDKKGEEWEPLFGYGGFRYVQAEWTPVPGSKAAAEGVTARGELLGLKGVEVHSDAAVTGTFASSNEMLNRIHGLIVTAMHNNEMTLFTDCPHREKLGWLEQDHLVAPGLMFNNDVQRMYVALDRNIADAQWESGIVPTTAPEYVVFGKGSAKNAIYDDSPEWGSASVLGAWWAYRFYGDKAELERDYAVMKRYVGALNAKAVDGVVAYGLGDWYDIGPGGPGLAKNTTLGVTGTMMLLEDAQAMREIALLLGHADDAAEYAALAERTKAAFNKKFWDAEKGWYDRGSQTAQAMPLALGAVPKAERAKVLEHLIADIHAHEDHVTAGEVGFPYVVRALMQAGRDDVLMAMLMRKDPPSYGSQLAAGATSLTEAWDANPHSSQDHFMLGSADEWFYRGLGGIDIDLSREDVARRLTLRPRVVQGVDWVKCGFDSKLGHVQSDWKREGDGVVYTLTVPAGASATVVLPEGAVAREGQIVVKSEGGSAVATVSAGTWTFRARG